MADIALKPEPNAVEVIGELLAAIAELDARLAAAENRLAAIEPAVFPALTAGPRQQPETETP